MYHCYRDHSLLIPPGSLFTRPPIPQDRIGLLHTLATLPEHPESVPINSLVPIDGGLQ